MLTLKQCYGSFENRFAIYDCDGATLVRFESKLLINGKVDISEVIDFAAFLGVDTIEILATDLEPLNPSVSHNFYSIFSFEKAASAVCEDVIIQPLVDMPAVFAILKASDAKFSASADYLSWLSRCTRLYNENCGMVYSIGVSSTASVTAIGPGTAVISQLATDASHRGQHLARKLLFHINGHFKQKNLSPVLVSYSEKLDVYYRHIGLVKINNLVIITL